MIFWIDLLLGIRHPEEFPRRVAAHRRAQTYILRVGSSRRMVSTKQLLEMASPDLAIYGKHQGKFEFGMLTLNKRLGGTDTGLENLWSRRGDVLADACSELC